MPSNEGVSSENGQKKREIFPEKWKENQEMTLCATTNTQGKGGLLKTWVCQLLEAV